MTDVVVRIAAVLGNFAARRSGSALRGCSHCGSSRMVRSYVRGIERWCPKLLYRSPFRGGSCSHEGWRQPAVVSARAVDDRAWGEACARPDIDTLDLSEVDQSIGARTRAGKIASVSPTVIDWQIVALVRNIEERMNQLQSRRHGVSSRYQDS
jgi:hypothetical protein